MESITRIDRDSPFFEVRQFAYPQKRKMNLDEVKALLNILCPKCGGSIAPDKHRRTDIERVVCPECGQRFIPST